MLRNFLVYHRSGSQQNLRKIDINPAPGLCSSILPHKIARKARSRTDRLIAVRVETGFKRTIFGGPQPPFHGFLKICGYTLNHNDKNKLCGYDKNLTELAVLVNLTLIILAKTQGESMNINKGSVRVKC